MDKLSLVYSRLEKPTCGDPNCDVAENPEHWVEATLGEAEAHAQEEKDIARRFEELHLAEHRALGEAIDAAVRHYLRPVDVEELGVDGAVGFWVEQSTWLALVEAHKAIGDYAEALLRAMRPKP